MRQLRAGSLPLLFLLPALFAVQAFGAELTSSDRPTSPDDLRDAPAAVPERQTPAPLPAPTESSAAPTAQPATSSSSLWPSTSGSTEFKDAPRTDATQASVTPDTARTDGGTRLLSPDTELIDMPTAAVVDYGSFATRTRFFSNGGVLEWLSFGVFQRLNIGASLNVDRLLGTQTPVQITRPDLQVKFRFYDGTTILPALAVGFDGQGYMYNRIDHRYDQRQRGLYLVGSQEIGIPGLQANAGINIPDFDNNPVAGFMGASYNIQDQVLIMAEWDNIANFPDSRLNTGFRVYITPNFSVDFAARTIGQGGKYTNGVDRGAERIVQLKYTGSF